MNLILKIVLTICLTCFIHLPIFILFILPMFGVRYFISVLCKIFKPDLIELIDSRNTLLAVDELETRPLSTIFITALFEGEPNYGSFCRLYEDRIINAKYDRSDKLRFPELQQYYEPWMGYLFWKKDSEFNLQNHIKLLSIETVSELTSGFLLEMSKGLEKEPFEPGRSPWKIFFIQTESKIENVSPKWGLIFKFHHGLADGYALVNSFMEITDVDRKTIILAKPTHRNLNFTLLGKLALIAAPFIATTEVLENFDSNVWHNRNFKLSRNWNVICSKGISIDAIKSIKNSRNVGFTAVLLAGVSEGIRNFFELNDLPFPRSGSMHAILSQPWPNHPMKFGSNHWTFGYVPLRITIRNSYRMLESTHKALESLKNSLAPIVNYLLFPVLGILPNYFILSLCQNIIPTMFITSIPADGKFGKIEILGNSKMIDVKYWAGHTRGNVGLSFCFISYDKKIQFVMTVDEKLIQSKTKAQELAVLVEHALINFHQSRDGSFV